ncbi:peptidylprolyl isomerase [Flammeovirga sp. MY04]|uniref:peptidylprolyl isomerase n=1 Tax=Flammeovirga sp. MY04 TaxID=1191459 RepID=UPI000806278C|nr:peptidylprolyl isomerase [Flammeovirga sp. MY04]
MSNYKFLSIFYLFFLGLFIISCSEEEQGTSGGEKYSNKFQDHKIREIYSLRDERNTKELLKILKDTVYQEEVLIALGSVQDTLAISDIKGVLIESNHLNVKIAAAFALGQMGDRSLSPFIIDFIVKHQKETELLEHMFESLGKCANDGAIYLLTHFVLSDENVMFGIVKGLHRAKDWQGYQSYDASEQIMRIFTKSKSVETKEWCSAYFARINSKHMLETFNSNIFDNARHHENELIRANFTKAIQNFSKGAGSATALKKILTDEKSPIVLQNALMATEKVRYSGVINKSIEYLSYNDPIVAEIAAQSIYNKLGWSEAKEVFDILEVVNFNNAKAEAMKAILRKRNKDKKMFNYALENFENAPSVYEKTIWLEAITESKFGKHLAFDTWKTTDVNILKTKSIELVLNDYSSKFRPSKKEGEELKRILEECIATKDVSQIYNACQFIQNKKNDHFKSHFPSIAKLNEVKDLLELPLQVEAYIELEKTIAFLEGKEFKAKTSYPNKGIQWEYIKDIEQNQIARIKTEKGDIDIQLKVEEAPATVAMFVSLIDSGFYNHLHFHRMVPNFVTQGGDPRGDGFGGLDYNIPSEFSMLNYKRGSLGIASAGKDTESCQFFFSLVPTHHLDGRYTIFSEVVDGFDVMQKLEYGDEIIDISIIREEILTSIE